MRGRPILAMHIDVTPDQLLGAAARCRIMELSNEVYPPGSIPDWVGAMQWAPKTIHSMVWNEGLLVCHVGALVRDVIIDGRLMQVGGIGGVMTAPAARRRGHARAALAAMGRYVIDDQQSSCYCFAPLISTHFTNTLGGSRSRTRLWLTKEVKGFNSLFVAQWCGTARRSRQLAGSWISAVPPGDPAVATRSDALEAMQGNFGKTIKADGRRSAPHANRGVADHVTIFPWPRAHMPWQNKGDRDRPGQTDLTSVGMATEK